MTQTTGNNEEVEDVYYEDADTRGEILLQCYNAIAAIEQIDCYINEQVKKKERVKKKCLDIIDYYISEIHAEIFDEQHD